MRARDLFGVSGRRAPEGIWKVIVARDREDVDFRIVHLGVFK